MRILKGQQPEFEAPAAALAKGIRIVCQNAMDRL